MSWLKRQIEFLFNSIFQIIEGLILFSLIFSGFFIALALRHFGYNGTIILGISLLIEVIGIVACFFIFKTYLKTEESKPPESKMKEK